MQLRLLEIAVGDAAFTLSGRMLAAVAKLEASQKARHATRTPTPAVARAESRGMPVAKVAGLANMLIPDQVGMESTTATLSLLRAAAADAASKLHLLSARLSDETPLRCSACDAHYAYTSAGRWNDSPSEHTVSNAHQTLRPSRAAYGSPPAWLAGLALPTLTCRAANSGLHSWSPLPHRSAFRALFPQARGSP